MAQKNIGTGWTRESRNAMNDNFDELYANYIGAGSSAAEAERLAREAVAAAKAAKIESALAKEEAEETQRQLDTLIIESGTSDAEVIQARKEYPLLKDRLDASDAQLADTATDLQERGLNAVNLGMIPNNPLIDNSTAFKDALLSANNTNNKLTIPSGVYKISKPISISDVSNISVEGIGSVVIDATELPVGAKLLTISGTRTLNATTVSANILKGSYNVTVTSASGFSVGDMIQLSSNEVFNNQRPTEFFKSEFGVIKGVDAINNILTVESQLRDDYNATGYVINVHKIVPCENIKLDNIKFLLKPSSKQDGVSVSFFKDLKITGITVEDAEHSGIYLSAGINASVKDCTVKRSNQDGLGYGIYFNAVQEGFITNCSGENCRHSIEVGGNISRSIIVYGNIVKEDIAAGIATHGGTEHISIKNNQLINCAAGIITRGRFSEIVGNKVIGTSGVGITVGEAETSRTGEAGKFAIVSGNTLTNCDSGAIYAPVHLFNSKINDNIIYNCGKLGYSVILLNGSKQENTQVDRNILVGGIGSNTGISIIPTPTQSGNNQDKLTIRNNIIESCGGRGIGLKGANTTTDALSTHVIVSGNIVTKNGSRGIDITGHFKNLEITDNAVLGNISSGLNIPVGTAPTDKPKVSGNVGYNRPSEKVVTTAATGSTIVDIPPSFEKPVVIATVEGDKYCTITNWTQTSGQYDTVTLQVKNHADNLNSTASIVHVLIR